MQTTQTSRAPSNQASWRAAVPPLLLVPATRQVSALVDHHVVPGRRRTTRARRAFKVAWSLATLSLLTLFFASALWGAPGHEYLVPIPDEQVLTWALAIDQGANPPSDEMRSVISLTFTLNGTVMSYDHWEDGFEARPGRAEQATTDIWGDGLASTGCPPTKNGAPLVCSDANDVLDGGDVVVLENDVFANPRNPAEIRFDGGDLIATSDVLAVTRAGWPVNVDTFSGVVLAGAVEVYMATDWGVRFLAPVGEDVASSDMFEYAAFSIMAGKDGTLVAVDVDGDGSIDQSATLARGESLLAEGVDTGGEVLASKPVQVDLLTGDVNTTYEARWFALQPVERWSSVYYTPVGETDAAAPVSVIAFNPASSEIVVGYETVATSGSFAVPAGGIYEFSMPANSGARFEVTATTLELSPAKDTWLNEDAGFTGDNWGACDRMQVDRQTYPQQRSLLQFDLSAIPPGATILSADLVLTKTGPGNSGIDISTFRMTASWDEGGLCGSSGAASWENRQPGTPWTTAGGDYDGTVIDTVTVLGNGDYTWAVTSLVQDWVDGTYTNDGFMMKVEPEGGSDYDQHFASSENPTVADRPKLLVTYSAPAPFYAVSTIDYDNTTSDWGFSLIPEDYLATAAVVGWAPGSEDLSENGSPVWVTAEANTTLHVDFDGDGVAEQTYPLNRLESLRIRDGGDADDAAPWSWDCATYLDCDQTGMRVWTEDGTLIAAAWGQEPGVAAPGSPSFDLGTAVLPSVNPILVKEADLAVDRNGNGLVDPGDTLLYTVRLKNVAAAPMPDPVLVDTPDANVAYEPDTTRLNGVPIADDPGPATPYPLDEGGYTVATLQPGESVTLTYQMTIADPLPAGVWSVQNQVSATAGDGSTTSNTQRTVTIPGIRVSKSSDAGGPVIPGQTLTYTVTVSNPSSLTAEDVFVLDALPAGTVYVPQSTVAMGPGPVTKDNIPGGANPDLFAGSPPDLVLPVDDFDLADLDTLTITFQVQVVAPADPNLTRVLNVATASSPGMGVLVSDQVIDPLSTGGEIGDLVWLDVDGDGVWDLGEPGIANVTMELLDGSCTPGVDCPIAVTDLNGRYAFNRLLPRSYQVAVDEMTLPGLPGELVRAPGTVSPSGLRVISATEIHHDVDFGYVGAPNTSLIGDFVWSDASNDGLQDPGEVGIGGVTLDLVRFDTLAWVATTTTAADGSYLFTGVVSGKYRVDVTDTGGVLGGYSLTTGPQSNTDPTGVVNVKKDKSRLTADFGYYKAPTFSIAEVVWLDADADGLRGPAESGIGGVTVVLVDDLDGDGARDAGEPVVSSVVSDAGGDFSFAGLEAGDFLVVFEDVDAVLVGMSGTTSPAQAFELAVTVGPDHSQVSFGYTRPGKVGDRVWSDANGDGLQGSEEPGLVGVTLDLWLDDGDGLFDSTVDFFQSSTTTDAAGSYFFTELEVGAYFVSVDDDQAALAGASATTSDQQTGLNALGTQIEAVLLVSEAGFLAADFGYQDTDLFEVSGNVFEDFDADGFDDGAGEPGLEGVTLDLVDPGADTLFGTGDDVTVAVATADAQGDYLFAGVAGTVAVPRDYRVEITDTAGLLTDYELTSGLDVIEVTVSDAAVTGIDFGYVRDARTGTIGSSVWLDTDGDGFQGPSESGLPGIVVDLYEDADGDGLFEPGGDDGAPIATTVTDADGRYVLTGLPAGDYFVDLFEATLPANLSETTYPPGADPSALIALSESEVFSQADFGFMPDAGTAALGDRVWHDTNGDGTQDDGEVGIQGVNIIVSGPSGDVTVTTGFDGSWLVTGLAAAVATDYSVNFEPATVPAGMTRTFPSDLTYLVSVDDGDLFTHLDYGFTGGMTGTLGDRIWLDLDGDGIRAGEPGIEGVTLSLIRDTNADGVWDPDGADDTFGTTDDERIVETVTSDAVGSYQLTGMSLADAGDGDGGDADYLVDVTDMAGVLAGLQKTTGTPDTDEHSQADPYPVMLDAATPSVTSGDFGYTPAGGFGSIGNKVWRDLDGDGFRDGGEPGIEGVTVELWLDVDGDGVLTPGTDNRVRTATTDTNGEYAFRSVPFGDYLVDVTDALDVLAGFVKSTGPLPGVDDNSQVDPCPMTLAAASDVTADFGYRADPIDPVLMIAGTVFEDTDNDATFDDGTEPEIENATVFLFRDLDGDGVLAPAEPLIASLLTDANGDFRLAGLPAGDYLVVADVTGTSVDSFLQTTQTSSGGVEPVTLVAASSSGHDFGFWNGGVVTNPITLAWFHAEERGGGVHFEWMTATETGNIGFNLYALGETGMRRLNDELIPSAVIDSLEPQRYELDAWDAVEESFVLEDVDLLGVRRYHGPFDRGETRGSEPETEQVPWGEIRAERSARRAARRAAAATFGRPAVAQDGLGLSSSRKWSGGWPTAHLEVSEDGIYRVSYGQLLAAGVDLAGAPAASLALLRGQESVAIRVEGGNRFGPGSFIEFIGEAMDTLYTRTSVYTLQVWQEKALPVYRQNRPASPWAVAPSSYVERLEVNRDEKYILTAPGEDPWYEDHLLAYGGSASRVFTVEVDGYAGGPAALEVELWGLSQFPRRPDHHVELDWNGSSFGEEWFDGQIVHRVTTELSSGALVEGANELQLTLPGDGGTAWDMVAMDRLWLTYARRFLPRQGSLRFEAKAEVFEVEGLSPGEVVVYRVDGERPVLVGGLSYVDDGSGPLVRFAGQSRSATYHVAEVAALRVPVIESAPALAELPGAARLLVISHGDFLGEVQPLVDARRAEGWTVEVVDVEQVYRRWSHGVVDPEALRQAIRWANRERGTEAVLLVGGDTYDYHDNLGLGSISFVPSLYVATDELVRFAPVDPLYGDVDLDLVPDVAVGRLPVRTPDELTSLVTRILEYGDSPFAGTALLAADAQDSPAGYSFAAASEGLAAMLPADWTLDRVYLDELGLADARDRLIGGINAGVGLTSYFGHSGPTAWSFQNLFKGADAAALENSGRPTVVAQWGCWNNYHVTPKYNTLGHKLLLSGDRGAAAVLGAATLTQAQSERKLGRLLFARLGRPGVTLGQALVEAKRELAQTEPDLVDVILGWTLLGDPTLAIDH